MPNSIVIGVDLGGTRLRAARLDDQLQVLHREEVLTHAQEGVDATLERIQDMIARVLPDDLTDVEGIGISVPGPSNPRTGVVVAPPNLRGWHNVPLLDILRRRFDMPIYIGNDANVAALAEVVRGAARGTREAIFVTVSTGIGGGIVSDGKMLLGKDGLAAEIGHMVIIVNDRVTTLEKEAAGPSLARQLRERIMNGEPSIASELVNGQLELISGSTVGSAAMAGDKVAISIVERAGYILGLGMVSLLHVFNPEILVFGGGVSNIGELLFAPMRAAIEKYTIDPMYWKNLRIERAALGDNVSLVGAGALVITQGGVSDINNVLDELANE